MSRTNTRREFLKNSGLITAGTVLATSAITAPRVHAAESNLIKIASIGCGGRGNGATRQALNADPNVVLWAAADVFPDKVKGSMAAIKGSLQKKKDGSDEFDNPDNAKKFDVPEDRQFSGFDSYKKAMDCLNPGDVVLLTTPPAFRPLHFAYAVEKGLNVFAEKPVAVDIPGLKSLRESNKIAQEKGLKVAVGLNNRHYFRTEETVKALQGGQIGDLISGFVYRMQSIHKIGSMGDQNPLAFQIKHLFNFNWTTGGFLVDALIHNLDVCAWAMGGLPVAAQGCGGRPFRKPKDQLIDFAAVEYFFADGRRMMMQTKTMDNTWPCFQAVVHGTKGSAILGEGVGDPKMFSHFNATKSGKDPIWKATAPGNDSYQTEHDRFFKAIRDNQSWNEMERGIEATFTPILGRMAMETGQYVKAEDAWNSTFQYVKDIAALSFDGPAPIMPDANGDYPQAIPGFTTINGDPAPIEEKKS